MVRHCFALLLAAAAVAPAAGAVSDTAEAASSVTAPAKTEAAPAATACVVASTASAPEAFLAAANRVKYIVEFYRDSPLVEQALEVMVESYDKLGLSKLKEDTYQVLKLNFPDNNKF